MSTLNGKSVASTYDQVVKRQDSYSATGNQIEIMDDSGVIKTTPLYLDSVNSRVGIGTASPAKDLDVSGEIRASTGLLFGTDTAAANTLDDYEEGTWSPGWSDGTHTDATYSNQDGFYTKIGNRVYVNGQISTSDMGTITGSLNLTGLPFTSDSTGGNRSTIQIGWGSGLAINAGDSVTGYIEAGTSQFIMRIWNVVTGANAFTEAMFSDNGQIMFSAEYQA